MTHRELLSTTRILGRGFFTRQATVVARDLLGKILVHRLDGNVLADTIVETEAYLGKGDEAAHSARGLTKRTAVIFGPPGHAYVYLCYGMYECLNLVTEPEGQLGCVLIRALEPLCGLEKMRERRPKTKLVRDLASGPGKLTRAMGVTREHYGADVTNGRLQVRAPRRRPPFEIVTIRRIGIAAGAELPLRFYVKGNEYVSVR